MYAASTAVLGRNPNCTDGGACADSSTPTCRLVMIYLGCCSLCSREDSPPAWVGCDMFIRCSCEDLGLRFSRFCAKARPPSRPAIVLDRPVHSGTVATTILPATWDCIWVSISADSYCDRRSLITLAHHIAGGLSILQGLSVTTQTA